jgi:hypothetical protein
VSAKNRGLEAPAISYFDSVLRELRFPQLFFPVFRESQFPKHLIA